MTGAMPDFAMPSAEEVERARARADDEAREAEARVALERRDAVRDEGGDVTPVVAAPPTRDRPLAAHRGGRILALARNPVIAFAAGALLVATGFLAVPQLTALAERGSTSQMREVFDAYVDAVADGDVDAALALHTPDPDQASLDLLEAGIAPTTLPVLTCTDPEVRGEGDVASASCETSLPGFGAPGMTSLVRLERIDGDWRIVTGLASPATLLATLFEVTAVAGVEVDAEVGSDPEQHWLLPGSYDVETRTSDLIEVQDFGGLMVAAGAGYLQLYAQPAPTIVEEAEAAVLGYVDACLVDAASAATCGLEEPVAGAEVSVLGEQGGFQQSETALSIPVRVTGTGTFPTPTIEVIVEFSPDWSAYELEVAGVTNAYG